MGLGYWDCSYDFLCLGYWMLEVFGLGIICFGLFRVLDFDEVGGFEGFEVV